MSKKIITELYNKGMTPVRIKEHLAEQGIRSSSGSEYSIHTIRKYVSGLVREEDKEVVYETIGRTQRHNEKLSTPNKNPHGDYNRTDYVFWDAFRKGRAFGFEFAGLFGAPITQTISSYVFQEGLTAIPNIPDTFSLVDSSRVRRELKEFTSRLSSILSHVLHDLYALGDQFLYITTDSIQVISPNNIAVEYHTTNSRKIKRAVVDSLDSDGKSIKIEFTEYEIRIGNFKDPKNPTVVPNPIGIVPIVHIANDRSSDEFYGRPIYEALYTVFSRYDDLLNKSLSGAEIMGNPIPMFSGVENIPETLRHNSSGTEYYNDENGVTVKRDVIRFDKESVIMVGKGGSFGYASPPIGFTSDIRDMLKSLFILIMEFTRIPEFLWGVSVPSSRASVSTQLIPFIQYIKYKQAQLIGIKSDNHSTQLNYAYEIWKRYLSFHIPSIMDVDVDISLPVIDATSDEIKLEYIKYFHDGGVIDSKTALGLSDLLVESPTDTPENHIFGDEESMNRAISEFWLKRNEKVTHE